MGESRHKVCGDLAGQDGGERGWGTAAASLQSVSLQLVVRMSDHRGAAVAITLKLGHK